MLTCVSLSYNANSLRATANFKWNLTRRLRNACDGRPLNVQINVLFKHFLLICALLFFYWHYAKNLRPFVTGNRQDFCCSKVSSWFIACNINSLALHDGVHMIHSSSRSMWYIKCYITTSMWYVIFYFVLRDS